MRSETSRDRTEAAGAGVRLLERLGRYLQIGSIFIALLVIGGALSLASPYS